MSSVPIVRVYEDRDRDAVVEIVRSVFEEYGFIWEPEGYNRDLFEVPQRYQDANAEFFVAEADGTVVGCGGIRYFPAVPGRPGALTDDQYPRICGCDCELVRLYVHARARRQGVGTALLSRIVAAALRRGCARMEIWSDRLLVDAHRMYERYGAMKVGTRLCPPPDEMPEWGMMLDLADAARRLP